jgi:serine/threonine protein kinase
MKKVGECLLVDWSFVFVVDFVRKELGQGTIGRVCFSYHVCSFLQVAVVENAPKSYCAVKSIPFNKDLDPKSFDFLSSEDLKNPHLLKYHTHFSENGKEHIFMDYCEKGNLEQWVREKGRVDQVVCCYIF